MGTEHATVLEELLTQLREVLVPYYDNSDPSAYVAMCADDLTYFDPWAGHKLEGGAAKDHVMAFKGQIPGVDYEILDAAADLAGDAAVLTFNLDARDRSSGERVALWNATQVHRRTDTGWDVIHAHWSFAEPPKEDLGD